MTNSGTAQHSQNAKHAVIVGAGPNGLTTGALLAQAGWQVDIYEASPHLGGAARSQSLLGEGTISDLGAAAHPFGIASPVFSKLGLEEHGLKWAHSKYPMAHPFDDGHAAFLKHGVNDTAQGLGADARHWKRVHRSITKNIDKHLENVLGPVLRMPPHPLRMAQFGAAALLPARTLANAAFETEDARALFSGSAVHAITPPDKPLTAAFGLLFNALGMSRGWPVAVGGTQAIADALAAVVTEHGGKIHLEEPIEDLSRFKAADAIVLNLTPAQVLRLKGVEVADSIERKMKKWRYGPSSYKIDFLLDGPIPWKNPEVANATTVHVCGSADEIRLAEAEAAAGRMPDRPFVLVCQQQAADPTRAREGKHVVWAYAHVPRGFVDKRAGGLIANQIERFAPGFRDRVIQAVTTDANQLEDWNPNLVGGDVAAGATDGLQSIVRMPSKLGPKTYMASASNAPGGGVHGMPGAWAARAVLADHH